VGCAEGKFLWALDASRWERCGVERDAAVVALVQGRIPGLHLVAGDEASAELEAESFDAVTCWHVFEHLHDPPVVMARLARLLRPGGRLFLSLPNLASLQAALFRRHWYPFDDVPRHLYHFSPRSLELLGARSGLAPAGRHFFSRRLNFHSLRHSAAHWAEARFGSRRPYRLLKPALALFPLLEAATGRPGIITVVLVKGGVNSEG
jgi:SAM-dependent methyltransferase